jgi:hypothetical protein
MAGESIPLSRLPPTLLSRLRSLPGTRTTVHVILEEDVYETCFGDGRFLYPREAFLDEPSARARLAELQAENERKKPDTGVGYRYVLKAVQIERQEHENRILADLKMDRDERCSLEDLVRLLTAK